MKKPKQVYTMLIRSTPKKTWDAITKPAFTRKYWGKMANVSDWKKGSKWEHLNQEKVVWVTGTVVECVPAKRLVISWIDPDNRKDTSRVTFELEKLDNLVLLTVTHDNFSAASTMSDKVAWGWPRVLSSLKTFLETGKGLNIFCGSED